MPVTRTTGCATGALVTLSGAVEGVGEGAAAPGVGAMFAAGVVGRALGEGVGGTNADGEDCGDEACGVSAGETGRPSPLVSRSRESWAWFVEASGALCSPSRWEERKFGVGADLASGSPSSIRRGGVGTAAIAGPGIGARATGEPSVVNAGAGESVGDVARSGVKFARDGRSSKSMTRSSKRGRKLASPAEGESGTRQTTRPSKPWMTMLAAIGASRVVNE